jgi:hypothetical protein
VFQSIERIRPATTGFDICARVRFRHKKIHTYYLIFSGSEMAPLKHLYTHKMAPPLVGQKGTALFVGYFARNKYKLVEIELLKLTSPFQVGRVFTVKSRYCIPLHMKFRNNSCFPANLSYQPKSSEIWQSCPGS